MSTALAVRDLIDRSPMSRAQTIAITLTFLLSAPRLRSALTGDWARARSACYVLSWLPQMVADAGISPSAASLASAAASPSGVVGGLLFG